MDLSMRVSWDECYFDPVVSQLSRLIAEPASLLYPNDM